jgi:predicted Zn-dependent protease
MPPGGRPPPESDEAGLWMQMDRAEAALRTSGRLSTDPALTSYVRAVVCRVAGPLCSDLRIYVVRTPNVNASMAPNGAMQVWTGLLLRVDNEAQLAYVLGHEIAHYIKRHSIAQWRDLRDKAAAMTFLRALTGAAGIGFVGDLGTLITLGTIFAFSREHEREADLVGIGLLRAAGYDVREAPRIWEALREEQRASKTTNPFVFFATHPPTDERIATLRQLASASAEDEPRYVGAEAYRAVTRSRRATLLRAELRRRELAGSQVLLARLLKQGDGLGELHFFHGELYRLRAEDGDEARAIAAYEQSLQFSDAPPEAHRGRGLLLMKSGDRAQARLAFTRYLEAQPNATDRPIIESYLRQLE